MGKESHIEWTDATWNPWYGCHKVSQGCKNCYMFRDTPRFGKDPNTVVRSKTTFYDPLKWKEPRRIFTCSWSDFFIEEADPWRDEAFAIMALTPQHTYQVLTKRPERMLEYLNSANDETVRRIAASAIRLRKERKLTFPEAEFHTEPLGFGDPGAAWFPLKNVWLGVSVEDRDTYTNRLPHLVLTPGVVKFLSIEPLLGDLGDLMLDGIFEDTFQWAIVGGESGPDARPMHPDWARSLRDQCTAAGVPFFFKQWGEWQPCVSADEASQFPNAKMHEFDDGLRMVLTGKKRAGRKLDGRTWDEMPEAACATSA